MEDLNGLSWSSDTSKPNKPPPMGSGYLFPSIPSNGGSGRSTPMSATSNRSSSPSKPPASTGDSFANLVSFGPSGGNKNLSLAEQQKRMQEEKAKKEAENRSRFESQYGGQNNQFWDNFEQGRTQSPAAASVPQSAASPADEDDILAAFNAAAPVDASTHFPVPNSARSSPQVDTNRRQTPSKGGISMQDNTGGLDAFDDDDPFGLNQLKPKAAPAPVPEQGDDDDFLGLLGKPISEIPRQSSPLASASPSDRGRDQDLSSTPSNDVDRAIAELVDMGFPADKSRRALKTTESGTDVQAAVGWLLTQAHAESRQKSDGLPGGRPAERSDRSDSRRRDAPSWMREERTQSRSRDNRSPASADKDPAQIASQFGNNLLKSAGSLWKTGSKKFQQAVNEFNTEHDPSQPRWMREPHEEAPPQPQRPSRREQPAQAQTQPQDFTNEALLLESGDGRPRKPTRPRESPQPDPRSLPPRNQPSPGTAQQRQPPNFLQRPSRQSSQEPKSRISRFAAEEQSAEAYISPARRRRPQASPQPEPSSVDLFDSPAPSASRPKPSPPAQAATPPTRSTPIPVRPKAPTRSIPPVSPQALESTHRHRGKAAESYKRGDYAEAHQSFSTALGMLPDKHPITMIIRSNRAMTGLKIGEPKSAIEDADVILTFIGPSKGESETIDLGNGEAPKPMKDFYGKALMRKAEALEQLERWGDAAQAWKLAVESGHGGSTSIAGRNRCEKAAGTSKPQLKSAAPAKKKPSPAPKQSSALSDLTATSASGKDFEAVSRLRQANQAAERADEEKFALTESVDLRLATWRNGKQDNLRALLGSLDSVLWPEAGWKKVGLAELVLPNKVKIQYMKGIGKVHPDKVCLIFLTSE